MVKELIFRQKIVIVEHASHRCILAEKIDDKMKNLPIFWKKKCLTFISNAHMMEFLKKYR